GAGKLLKNQTKKGVLGSVRRTAFGTGSGILGKIATDTGLTATGNMVFGTVGGGLASNMLSGLLNAGDAVNSNKDLVDENGEKIFSEEDLGRIATGTMRNNANYLIYDMASWGMTFGGGWKALKGLNPLAKGAKAFTEKQQGKIASNLFRYDINP